jgi:RNA polymerase sigma-70 factor (ECF subfamily)
MAGQDVRPGAEDPEYALSERLRALESEAWSELFDECRAKLWRYAYARTGDQDAADDITGQVFVEALNSIQRYQYRGKPVLAWLYTIARNHVGKLLRDRRRRLPLRGSDPAVDTLDRTLDSLLLADGLRSLTRDQEEVIALRFFGGYSTPDIARALGKSEAAVYSLEVRAIGSLRRYLRVDSEELLPKADKIWAVRGIER